jgi:hypothetical protein
MISKQKLYLALLFAEAAVCIIFHVIKPPYAEIFTAVAAFPFAQIGWGLRALSLSGEAGNAIAVIIYMAVCLPPLAIFFHKVFKKFYPEDMMLPLLSIVLFGVLYFMVNPGKMGIPAEMTDAGKMVLGGAVYSVLTGYVILRALRKFLEGDKERLMRYMSIMLGVLGVVFVFALFGNSLGEMVKLLTQFKENFSGNEELTVLTRLVAELKLIADAVSYAMCLIIVLEAINLTAALRQAPYSETAAALAGKTARGCTVTLSVTVVISAAYNVLQIVFIKSLNAVDVTVSIPVFSIAFVLTVLLLTRIFAENKRLKDENDTFI